MATAVQKMKKFMEEMGDTTRKMDSKRRRIGWSRWYPILDRIPEAEPVHFGGHALLRWEELAQKAVHWDEVGRWVGWCFAEKLEHFWMCEDC